MALKSETRLRMRMRRGRHLSTGRRARAKWLASITLIGSGLLLQGCEAVRTVGNANLPSQYVVASVEGDRRLDARVRTHRSASGNLQSWTSDVLFNCSGCPTSDEVHIIQPSTVSLGTITFGRGGSSPGIGSNGSYYVLAFWGRTSFDAIDAMTVAMYVSVSHDGITWTPPQPIHGSGNVHSNSQGIVDRAGISVASAGRGWFAAYADDTGAISVVALPVTSAGVVDTQISRFAVTVPGASTDRAPAFSRLGGDLVLAWHPSGSGAGLRILRTADGRSWPNASTSAVAMRSGASPGPLVLGDGSPFLHVSELALFLTTTSGVANSSGSLDLLTSTDALSFSPVSNFPVWSPSYDGAAAGPAPSQFVVVYPLTRSTDPQDSLVLTSANPQRTLETNTRRRVTVAGGPD